jgi:hypothetical protein
MVKLFSILIIITIKVDQNSDSKFYFDKKKLNLRFIIYIN